MTFKGISSSVESLLLSEGDFEIECRRLVLESFQLQREIFPWTDEEIRVIASELTRSVPLTAYTAFDGDHFSLTPQMRVYAMKHGRSPANPESILGYKQAVDAYLSKKEVLYDDIAIVQKCAEMWLFTDVDPEPDAVAASLAEGAVMELLWFLKRCPGRPIYFVPIQNLFGDDSNSRRQYWSDLESTQHALCLSGLEEVVALVDSVVENRVKLRPTVYFAHDPLDGKYVDWLRAGAYERKQVPIVPDVAIELQDAVSSGITYPYTKILRAWVSLMLLSDELLVLPPHQSLHANSPLVRVQIESWRLLKRGSILHETWSEYQIPKTLQGGRWPLSKREGAV